MSQIRSLYRALFANLYFSKLRFAVAWLGQIHNLDTGHVCLPSRFEIRLGRTLKLRGVNVLKLGCKSPKRLIMALSRGSTVESWRYHEDMSLPVHTHTQCVLYVRKGI